MITLESYASVLVPVWNAALWDVMLQLLLLLKPSLANFGATLFGFEQYTMKNLN